MQRRKELLAVVPPVDPWTPRDVAQPWSRLLADLAREWRVFVAPAPREGERLACGSVGWDAVSVDTMPTIRKLLSEQPLSAVLLVGEGVVLDHLEPLHDFVPHLPFLVALGAADHPRWRRVEPARLEFLLGWADRILVAGGSRREPLGFLPQRLSLSASIAPAPGSPSWAAFVDEISRGARSLSRELEKRGRAGVNDQVDWIAVMTEDSRPLWRAALGQWRRCLPSTRGAFLVPAADLPKWRGRLRKVSRRSEVIAYRGEDEALELANRVCGRLKRPHTLFLTPSIHLARRSVERMAAAARSHPLAGGACGNDVRRHNGVQGRMESSAEAWFSKYRGARRLVPKLPADCFLVRREALSQTGCLDPQLGWTYAVHDLSLRLRQNGWALFQAQDAAVGGRVREIGPRAGARRSAFLRKWDVDPAEFLNGDGDRA